MSGRTHVVTYDGGTQTAEISARKDISAFLNPLRHFNGKDQWALGLAPIPAGTTYGEMLQAGELSTEYIQAAGLPDAMTVEIRKPGGYEWGATWVRYTIGRPHSGTLVFASEALKREQIKLFQQSFPAGSESESVPFHISCGLVFDRVAQEFQDLVFGRIRGE